MWRRAPEAGDPGAGAASRNVDTPASDFDSPAKALIGYDLPGFVAFFFPELAGQFDWSSDHSLLPTEPAQPEGGGRPPAGRPRVPGPAHGRRGERMRATGGGASPLR